jgi:hypothetical protein
MLQVYRLLECGDAIQTEGDFLNEFRRLVSASATQDLMLVQNEIFVGRVRERAQLPKSAFKSATLAHLLRQAIVASCTALDAYLPALLRLHLHSRRSEKRGSARPGSCSNACCPPRRARIPRRPASRRASTLSSVRWPSPTSTARWPSS